MECPRCKNKSPYPPEDDSYWCDTCAQPFEVVQRLVWKRADNGQYYTKFTTDPKEGEPFDYYT